MIREVDEPSFSVVLVKSGRLILESGDRQVVVEGNSIGIIDTMRPFRVVAEHGPDMEGNLLVLRLPHTMIRDAVDQGLERLADDRPESRILLSALKQIELYGRDLGAERLEG
jgi:hypothetical protein